MKTHASPLLPPGCVGIRSGRSWIRGARACTALLLVYLDVALGDKSSVAVGEIRSGDADEKRVFACTRLTIITGIYSVLVAWLLVHLGITIERPAVARERD